jgi:hypothetical protein
MRSDRNKNKGRHGLVRAELSIKSKLFVYGTMAFSKNNRAIWDAEPSARLL